MNLDELKTKNEELEAKVKALEGAKTEVEAALAQFKQELDSANESIKTKDGEINTTRSTLEASQVKVDELVKANTELTEQINKAKAAELKANRVTKLVDGGIAKDNAEKKVELFASLSDEQFNAIADELIGAAKVIKDASDAEMMSKKEKDKMKKDMDDKDEDEKDSKGEEAVDNVEVLAEKPVETAVDPNLTVGSDTVTDKELDVVRNELAEAIASVLTVKKPKAKK